MHTRGTTVNSKTIDGSPLSNSMVARVQIITRANDEWFENHVRLSETSKRNSCWFSRETADSWHANDRPGLTPHGQTSTALHFRSNLRDGVLRKISNSQHKSTQRCHRRGRHHKIALMTKLQSVGVHLHGSNLERRNA